MTSTVSALVLNISAVLLNVALGLLWDKPYNLFAAGVSVVVATLLAVGILRRKSRE